VNVLQRRERSGVCLLRCLSVADRKRVHVGRRVQRGLGALELVQGARGVVLTLTLGLVTRPPASFGTVQRPIRITPAKMRVGDLVQTATCEGAFIYTVITCFPYGLPVS
jgi:hypothetical protein